jgi:hypothetical protein
LLDGENVVQGEISGLQEGPTAVEVSCIKACIK